MCGFLASCTCPHAEDNGEGNADIHDHVMGRLSRRITKLLATMYSFLVSFTYPHADGNEDNHRHVMDHFSRRITNDKVEDNGHTTNGRNGVHTNGVTARHTNRVAGANDDVPTDGTTREELAKNLLAGVDAIKHRGPDGSGVWVSQDGRVGLAHCRLSVNDLSPSGAQPLHSDDGLIHAVVNGEIYDHDRLRNVCAAEHGYAFSSESDSELVIALYKIHGAPGLFEHLRGEFAFVLFDERHGSTRTIAGRDRFGVKPLLWTVLDDKVLFASEAKAFLPMGWKPEWDVRGITDAGWYFDDRTIFKGVKKLMPGHWLDVIDKRGVEIHKYWDADYPDKTKPDPRTVEEMVLGVRERLVEAVRLRLRADVPIGVYLSGGIDSSTVAGIVTDLARKEGVRIGSEQATKVACFSIRFGTESAYDETGIAQRTAEWLGVESFRLDMDEDKLADNFADASYHYEHPHFDLNAVGKFSLSGFTREHGIKVVLTGEGSDEHFGGYPNFAAEFLREADQAMPGSVLARDDALREGLHKAAHAEINSVWRSQSATEAGVPADAGGSTMADSLVCWQPPKDVYSRWVHDQYQGNWDMRETIMPAHSSEARDKMRDKWHATHSAMYMWNKSTLLNLVLACEGDRTEMAHGVEGRTPFLDHHLTEYVNSLPPSVKLKYAPADESRHGRPVASALRSLTEKWILREAARPYLTDELYSRRKVTFWAPTRWPKNGRLHNMFKTLLTREAVEGLGFVDFAVVDRAMANAFGDAADPAAFRVVCYAGGWVTLAERFGIKKASVEGSGWIDAAKTS
ncbi:Asparagine synthase [Tolypocladium capitatum]|uniref:Asparagine synthase n=1 Tax=Tolypocladium capitatum TaxID=45235 RepID=A0A2K3QEB6_9HYPO|nr:Asparagine synthase [Tolypocladium capitatum]